MSKTTNLEIKPQKCISLPVKIRLIQEHDFLALSLERLLRAKKTYCWKIYKWKTRVENVRFLSRRIFFVRKYGILSTNEMSFKRTVPLREFRFPAIRFDAPTLLSFSGCTHAHANCPPVVSKAFFKSIKITPFRRPLSILTHQLSFDTELYAFVPLKTDY